MAASWLKAKGFKELLFFDGVYSCTTYYKDYPIHYKIEKRVGFKSFVKESHQGGLLVFEIGCNQNHLNYFAFSPILLFGFLQLKRKFKKKPHSWAKYLLEGYYLENEFASKFSK